MAIRPLITPSTMLTSAPAPELKTRGRGAPKKPDHLKRNTTLAFRVTDDVVQALEMHRIKSRFSERADAGRDLIIWALQKKKLLK